MSAIFYDFNVHSKPESNTSLVQLCEVAKKYGYSGIALTNHSEFFEMDLDQNSCNLEVIKGIEVVSEPSEFKDKIRKYRPKVTLLSVHGGDERINRMAVEDKRVDILCHPEEENGSGLNHILARSATKNDVAIEFDMGAIIHSRGRSRSRVLSFMSENLKLTRRYNTRMVLTSNSHLVYDLRAPREMMALASLFGMTREEATTALSVTPPSIIKRNLSRLLDGVEVVDSC